MLRWLLRCKIWRHICKHFQWLGKQLCFTTMECVHFPLVCTEPTDNSSTFKQFHSLRRTLNPSLKHSLTRTTPIQEVCPIHNSFTRITSPWITPPLRVKTQSHLHMAPWDISLSFQIHDNRVTGCLWCDGCLFLPRPSAEIVRFKSMLAHVHVDGKKPLAQDRIRKHEFRSVGGTIPFYYSAEKAPNPRHYLRCLRTFLHLSWFLTILQN